jgi:hypothetical protein
LKRVALVLQLALASLSVVVADDVEDMLEFISDKALSVQIRLRLLDKDKEITWDAESAHITVVGRAVNIRLVASDVIIDSYITPFGELGENLVLVANGEIWYTNPGLEKGIRYESFIKSLPVKTGEKVIFFPLGVAVDSDANIYTIQLEIDIRPYKEYLEQTE